MYSFDLYVSIVGGGEKVTLFSLYKLNYNFDTIPSISFVKPKYSKCLNYGVRINFACH